MGARFVTLAAAISLGTLAIVSLNVLIRGKPVISPSSSTFMLAKLLQDGPAFTILERNCPASGWALCKELEDLEIYRLTLNRKAGAPAASISDYFLWGGPLERLGWWKLVEPEAAIVVRQALLLSPLTEVWQSVLGSLRQLTRFSVGDALFPHGDRGEPIDAVRMVFGEATVARYLTSLQAASALPLKTTNVLQTIVVIASFGLLVVGGIRTRRRDPIVLYLTFAFCIFLFINAVVTATFSGVHDRYQSRIIWLIPLLASLTVGRWLTPGLRKAPPAGV
jgi:hypothetical protein